MFSNLFSLDYQRNTKEAFGFYIAYALLFLLMFLILGIFIGAVGSIEGYSIEIIQARVSPWMFGVESMLTIAFLLIFFIKKNLPHKGTVLFLGVVLGIFALFFGFLPTLIPIAYITTLPGGKKDVSSDEVDSGGEKKDAFWKALHAFFLVLLAVLFIFFLILLYNISESLRDIAFMMLLER